MSSTVADGPTVALSFANNFWGKGDAGYGPLLERMANAKQTNDELKAFYNARAALEEEYAKKLLALARKPLGSTEAGTLRASLDVMRGETEATGKAHAQIASQMKTELEEPLAAFAGGMKERRKIIQTGIERLMKAKVQQTQAVNKSRDRYEQDCLRIKGYLAQGHMVMGQEERKNKAKLEKTQINMASDSNEYESAVKVLEETTGRWNKEWKTTCDKFQDLEEERIDFTKSSLWSYANIASTVCVTDDASCEKIRLSLENCEVEKDIVSFIRERGTGQEIPDPPRYINFARGDVNDTMSEASEEDNNFSVAQFQRTINPAFRSASPNPSTYESHHDPQSELAIRMKHGGSEISAANEPPPALDVRRAPAQQGSSTYEPSQHGDLAQVPHNEYPTDGMTMFCRTGPPSTTGSGMTSQTRPSSRDSGSEYSNPTSFSSHDPVSGKSSPTKQAPINGVEMPGMSPDKGLQKKRSGFFSNSPFRRKSKHEKADSMSTPQSRNTWTPSSKGLPSQSSSPTKYGRPPLFSRDTNGNSGEEPVDPRASFQLNVGNNVFDVASPDSNTTPKAIKKASAPQEELDPIAQALADLKGNVGKQSSVRVSADRYHGIATPGPGMERPAPLSASSSDRLAAQRGTPPPAYDPKASGLGVPQPAFTSREMRERTAQYGNKMNDVYGRGSGGQSSRPGTRDGAIPRATSPSPMHQNIRSRSPGPGMMNGHPPQMRARSPGPGMHDQMRARSPGPGMMNGPGSGQYRAASPNPYGGNGGGRPRGQSMSPQKRGSDQGYGGYQQNSRHNSPQTGMEMQLSQGGRPGYGSNESGRGRSGMVRPQSSYGGDPYGYPQGGAPRGHMDPQQRRERSKSIAAPGGGGFTRDGRQILHYARAMYSYTAAIPEELTFMKNDVLAVLRLQDDGWWEAELQGKGRGLVPSNYLVRC